MPPPEKAIVALAGIAWMLRHGLIGSKFRIGQLAERISGQCGIRASKTAKETVFGAPILVEFHGSHA